MHLEAFKQAYLFKIKYLCPPNEAVPLKILDVGSYDVNGSMKPVFKEEPWTYHGLDLEKGPNVDIVSPMDKFPLNSETYHVVVSSSCFEHSRIFWITFNEMVRVLRKGGLMYINTPSDGPYHGYPSDCWRFYKDAYQALAEWNENVELLEQFIIESGQWKDNIGIFKKCF